METQKLKIDLGVGVLSFYWQKHFPPNAWYLLIYLCTDSCLLVLLNHQNWHSHFQNMSALR